MVGSYVLYLVLLALPMLEVDVLSLLVALLDRLLACLQPVP